MKTNKKYVEKLRTKIVRISWIANFLIVIGFVIAILGYCHFYSAGKTIKLNELGDFIGGVVGSLWSLSSILYIYVAFLSQQEQIEYQKIDLELTRNELAEQKEQMIIQNKTFEKQQFENTFFNLINLHNSIVANMTFGSDENIKTGVNCFEVFEKRLSNHCEGEFENINKNDYQIYYEDLKNILGRYYSNLNNIFNLINNIPETLNKAFYILIIQSQLSDSERSLLKIHSQVHNRIIPTFSEQ